MSFDVANTSAERIAIERVEVEVTRDPVVVVALPPAFVTAMDDTRPDLGPLCGWGDPELEPTSETVSDTILSAARRDPEFERASIFAAYATNPTNPTSLVGLVFGIAYAKHAEVNLLCAKRRERMGVGTALLEAFELEARKPYVTVAPTRNATGFYERRGYVRHDDDNDAETTLAKSF